MSDKAHTCPICGTAFETPAEAGRCAARGAFPALLPGTIVERISSDPRLPDTGGSLIGVASCTVSGHEATITHWVAGDVHGTGVDCVGGLCPADDFSGPGSMRVRAEDGMPKRPTRMGTLRLGRMSDFLRSRGLRPLAWDGQSARPLPGM